jgi:hypothetical protein
MLVTAKNMTKKTGGHVQPRPALCAKVLFFQKKPKSFRQFTPDIGYLPEAAGAAGFMTLYGSKPWT